MEDLATARRAVAGVFAALALALSGVAQALTCAELEGATVLSQEPEPVYLGFFGSQFAEDSIMNPFGAYGSSFSKLSVRNDLGPYGGPSETYSAHNSLTTLPPVIYKNLVPIAFLTTNSALVPGVSLAQIDADCAFLSSALTERPPLPPASVSASDGLYEDRVEVNWTEVSDAWVYNIYVSDTPESPLFWLGQTTRTSARIPLMSRVGPGDVKIFWVFSENAFGESLLGTFDAGYIAATAVPGAPTAVTASDGSFSDRVRVIWAEVSGAADYELYRCATPEGVTCGDPIFTGHPDPTRFDDFEADPHGALTFYRLKACNTNGCSAFSAANSGFRRVLAPDVPVGVSASDGAFENRVAVSWSPIGDATTYRVYRCRTTTTGSCGEPIATTDAPIHHLDDFGADLDGTVCYYRVQACKADICSTLSLADPGNIGVPAAADTILADGFESAN